MTDEYQVPQGGDPNPQQGNEADPTTAPVGGDQTQQDGSPAPTSWEDPIYRKGILDKTFRGGYADGRKKGARDAESRILKEFGVDSVDALRDAISQRELADHEQADQEQTAQEQAAQAKLIRSLKEERSTLSKQAQGLQGQLDRFRKQAERALAAEIKTSLLAMGAHEGVDDLVQIAARSLSWSSDGGEIEVVDHLPDGSVQPARETLQEYLDHLKQTKPWYFRSQQKQGSGSIPDQQASTEPPKDTDSFAARIRRWQGRS